VPRPRRRWRTRCARGPRAPPHPASRRRIRRRAAALDGVAIQRERARGVATARGGVGADQHEHGIRFAARRQQLLVSRKEPERARAPRLTRREQLRHDRRHLLALHRPLPAHQQLQAQQLRPQRRVLGDPLRRGEIRQRVERAGAIARVGERLRERQPSARTDRRGARRRAQVREAALAIAGGDAREAATVAGLAGERRVGRVDERREAVRRLAREPRLRRVAGERALEVDRGDAEAETQQQRLGRLPLRPRDHARHVDVALGRVLALLREPARRLRRERLRAPVELGERRRVALRGLRELRPARLDRGHLALARRDVERGRERRHGEQHTERARGGARRR